MCIPIETITATKDVILAIAGITTAFVAIRGLSTWNRQLRGAADFDVARSLAKCTYKLRDKIQACRSPMIWAHEFPPEYQKAGLTRTPQQQAEGYAFVYANRWEPVFLALQEFDATTIEAEALWGSAVRTATDQLRSVARQVNAAIDTYIDDAASGGHIFTLDRELGQEIRATISATSSQQENRINIALHKAVEGIDALILPHLRRGG